MSDEVVQASEAPKEGSAGKPVFGESVKDTILGVTREVVKDYTPSTVFPDGIVVPSHRGNYGGRFGTPAKRLRQGLVVQPDGSTIVEAPPSSSPPIAAASSEVTEPEAPVVVVPGRQSTARVVATPGQTPGGTSVAPTGRLPYTCVVTVSGPSMGSMQFRVQEVILDQANGLIATVLDTSSDDMIFTPPICDPQLRGLTITCRPLGGASVDPVLRAGVPVVYLGVQVLIGGAMLVTVYHIDTRPVRPPA